MNHQETTLPPDGYIRIAALVSILPMSKATIWRKSKNGTFPRPVKLSENITAWKVHEVRAWMDNREVA